MMDDVVMDDGWRDVDDDVCWVLALCVRAYSVCYIPKT